MKARESFVGKFFGIITKIRIIQQVEWKLLNAVKERLIRKSLGLLQTLRFGVD